MSNQADNHGVKAEVNTSGERGILFEKFIEYVILCWVDCEISYTLAETIDYFDENWPGEKKCPR